MAYFLSFCARRAKLSCHPKRSASASKASRRAQSKDPYPTDTLAAASGILAHLTPTPDASPPHREGWARTRSVEGVNARPAQLRTKLLKQAGEREDFGPHILVQIIEFRLELIADFNGPDASHHAL